MPTSSGYFLGPPVGANIKLPSKMSATVYKSTRREVQENLQANTIFFKIKKSLTVSSIYNK
jgi:hypothetical protein